MVFSCNECVIPVLNSAFFIYGNKRMHLGSPGVLFVYYDLLFIDSRICYFDL